MKSVKRIKAIKRRDNSAVFQFVVDLFNSKNLPKCLSITFWFILVLSAMIIFKNHVTDANAVEIFRITMETLVRK